ncbi:MAG TPA: prolyl oligopeptidase family serine peptidase [Thermoanaerobaculales bacterium]|nr:prolyl oligopeptidase family serine peptidase [Thermoanaerobaculales bacterium]HPA80963.1 prolyl oligopeptidase family serine peptidase [Thermoanaerobaculales bacterium]HQN96449.1 prolyl oligopeptidase family serine peptidase [Thermoanaerobaculales bacterium]HQP42093.1 prolyl oligopeptidase family serine peptidase [Thermoanaerobaculales bacterium]
MRHLPLALLALAIVAIPAAAADPADDPYLWLEEIDGERAMEWVAAQNARSAGVLEQVPEFAPIRSRILEIYDSKDRIPYVSIRGSHLYNFWQDAEHPRGIWRRTTLGQYRKAEPSWEALLDIDALAAADGEKWVFKGADCLPPAYERCMIALSPGGSDAAVFREFDVATRSWVDGGFALPLAKSEVAWRDENSLWVETDFGPGTLTASGYPRLAKLWARGTPLAAAAPVWEIPESWVGVGAYSVHNPEGRYDVIAATPEYYRGHYYLILGERKVKLDLPEDASLQGIFKDQLLVSLRSDWTVGGATYPQDALLAIDLDEFLQGSRAFATLFSPSERVSLSEVATTRHSVLIATLDNVRGRLYRLRPGDGGWTRQEIPLPGPGTAGFSATSDQEELFFFSYTDFLTPSSLYLVEGDGAPVPLKRSPAWFDAAGMTTAQYEATSKDGTAIPYFVVTPKGFVADGTTPTVLYGYGGFEIAELPTYSGTIGTAWLARGGVWVLANLRGGGEFGPKWHQAAVKENRHKVYEDFIAVAEDLIARRITSPQHLGIMGGSQGGLLVAATFLMRPELFGAVVSQVPLMDMQRYSKLLAGASWMGEYGNPDLPEEWAYIRTWSPYHLVRADAKYPEVFIWTTTRDDRVHPGHARKMAAKMIGQGHEVLYWENVEGGHGSGSTHAQKATASALEWAYLWRRLR